MTALIAGYARTPFVKFTGQFAAQSATVLGLAALTAGRAVFVVCRAAAGVISFASGHLAAVFRAGRRAAEFLIAVFLIVHGFSLLSRFAP